MDIDAILSEFFRKAAELRRLLNFAWPQDIHCCRHRHSTIVQMTTCDGDWLVTRQCDDCGMPIIAGDVTADDLRDGHILPWFDENLLAEGIERTIEQEIKTARFFGRAVP